MNDNNNNSIQLSTPALDLLAPANRFVLSSRLYGSLHRWWLLLGRYWWALALLVVAVLVPVYFISASLGPAYESKARMWITGKLDVYEGRVYTEELIDFLGTQAELLHSPVIENRALAKLKSGPLKLGDIAEPARLAQQRSFWGVSASPRFPFKVKAVEGAKSSTLDLRAVGADPVATRVFLDCLMDSYLEFKKESREKASDRTLTSVAGQVSQLEKELEAQQQKMHEFQVSNNIVFLQEQGNSASSYLALLNKQLATLHTELRFLRALQPDQWVEMQARHSDTAVEQQTAGQGASQDFLASLAGPQLELFKANQQAQLLKATRDQLSAFLRPQHPKILKLNEDIATQERLAQTSRDEALKQMVHRRQAVELEIQNLEGAFQEWDKRAIEASSKMADYDRIRQDLQRLQAAYDKLLGLIQTVDVSKKLEQENVGILEQASPAVSTHRTLKSLAIALFGSGLLSIGLLYVLSLFHDDFTSLTELENQLSAEVIGQIPSISLMEANGQPGIASVQRQRFEFLESFRSLRASLLFMGNGKPKPKAILVASSVPDEGKSTVALYLAATIAMANSRVLLIDADMRRATLHKFVGVAFTPGLAEILNRQISFKQGIVQTGLENLSFLPAGEPDLNPGELVLSPMWNRFLEETREQYDYIIVDTPPVLAADDASTLATKMDGVLFVVRGSYTAARMASGALDLLRQRHARVLGLVFNRAISSPYEHHYYQRYRDAYHWKPDKNGSTGPAGELLPEAANR